MDSTTNYSDEDKLYGNIQFAGAKYRQYLTEFREMIGIRTARGVCELISELRTC